MSRNDLRRLGYLFASLIVAWGWARFGSAKDAPVAEKKADANQETQFVRLTRDVQKTPTAMQTAVVRYQSPTRPGVSVDLVGAIHIADVAYYQKLNEEFKQYDAVLFELVSRPDAEITKGNKQTGHHPVQLLQDLMKSMLSLEHQLVGVDYTAKNFVHADMSPEEFSETMEKRGESFWSMMLKVMGAAIAQQNRQEANGQSADLDIIAALFDPDRSTALKRAMAVQFEDMGPFLSVLDGPEGSTILTERNKVALEVLRKQLDGGKKKVAIFYGAAHLPDMERRLASDFGLKPGEPRWLTAWDLASKVKKPTDGK
jgi:hypothetical protein